MSNDHPNGGDNNGDDGNSSVPSGKSPHYKADNSGGYGNPPVSGQFKGKAGPGRPKGSSNLGTAMRKVLKKKVEVRRGGKLLKLAPSEVFAERFLETALSGKASPAMMEYAKRIFEQYGPAEEEEPAKPDYEHPDYTGFSDLEFAFFGGLLTRALNLPPEGGDEAVGRTIDECVGVTFTISRRDDGHICIERVSERDEAAG